MLLAPFWPATRAAPAPLQPPTYGSEHAGFWAELGLHARNDEWRIPASSTFSVYKAKRGWKQLPHHSVMQQSQIMANDFCSPDHNGLKAPVAFSFPPAVPEPQRSSTGTRVWSTPLLLMGFLFQNGFFLCPQVFLGNITCGLTWQQC